VQLRWLSKAHSVEIRSIRAPQITQPVSIRLSSQLGMKPRCKGILDAKIISR
jgi:hypothetical protein